jgi:Patatin-like phospholipase
MTAAPRQSTPPAEPYSPQLRTALVLAGTGVDGVYHAGAVRALHEAGVKIDAVAGRGIGAVGALFTAIDGASQLWDAKGVWSRPAAARFYGWRPALRFMAWALAISFAIVAVPVLAVAAGLIVFPVDFIARMAGSGTPGLVGAYVSLLQAAFAPSALPTWVPRAVVLVLTAAALVLAARGLSMRRSRRARGRFWWRALRAPLSARDVGLQCWRVLWQRLGGAAGLRQPPPSELGRRYVDLLSENLDQPGFRELVVAVHDLDARRDVVFAVVRQDRRISLVRRSTTREAEDRRAEVFDLAGLGAGLLADALEAALAVPLVTEPHLATFPPDSFWRGETHRLCDRPAALVRLLDELANLGVEQAIIVSAAAESPGPHVLPAQRLEGRARVGEYLQSAEAATVTDAARAAARRIPRVFTIRPVHNPLGPFDTAGGFDEGSDRRQPLSELMTRGYEDAYRQFIDPVVAV